MIGRSAASTWPLAIRLSRPWRLHRDIVGAEADLELEAADGVAAAGAGGGGGGGGQPAWAAAQSLAVIAVWTGSERGALFLGQVEARCAGCGGFALLLLLRIGRRGRDHGSAAEHEGDAERDPGNRFHRHASC